MRVLFLMLEFPSDLRSSNLYLDLALEFYKNNHDVYIIAPASPNQKTDLYLERGLHVLRVQTLKQAGVKSVLKKGIAQILLPFQYRSAYLNYFKYHDFDMVFMPTPPITLIDMALFVKKRTKAKLYLILRDIYPQSAADIGLIRFKVIYQYLRFLEIKTYRNSDFIGCMSQGNIDYILKKNPYLSDNKITLLPNWQKQFIPDSTVTSIRKKYNLENKFIVLFGGTIGYAQKVENLVLLANHYRQNDRIVFLVIGNGVKKQYLQDLVFNENLHNFIFIEDLPREDYMNFVESSDIGLITIDERFTVPTIPSKTTSYMCMKLPVLAIIDANTDYGKLLDESGAGLWSVGGDDTMLFNNFEKLYADAQLRKEMGLKGHSYFMKNLTSEIAFQNIIQSS